MTEQQESTQQPMRPALRRSSSDRVISGVCGGLARTLGIDPVIVRVIVAILALLGGTGIAAYIIAWILIPDDDGSSAFQRTRGGNGRFTQFLLVAVLAIAGISLLDIAWPGKHGDGFGFFLFLLIAVVAWQAFGHGSWGKSTVTKAADGTTTIISGNGTKIVKLADDGGVEITKTREPKSVLGRIVWNALAVAVGVMLMLNYTDTTNLSGRTILAVAMAIIALGLLVSAFVGRARGLIALGLLVCLLMLPGNLNANHGTGERIWKPASVSAVHGFELGVGDATLDLTALPLALSGGSVFPVSAHVGAGQLTVIVPSNMNVDVHGKAGLGSVKVFDLPAEEGANASLESSFTNTPDSGTVTLDLSVGVGQIEVRYA